MKKNFIYILLVLVSNLSIAQKVIKTDKKLNEIKSEMDLYFKEKGKTEKDSSWKNEEGSEYQEYQKFINFWEPRLFPHGDFTKYFKAEEMFYNSKKIKGSGKMMSENEDPWHEVGPMRKPSTSTGAEGTGPIEFITFFEANPDYMLCGSLLGGLFYSTNAGSSWQHTATDTDWPRSGCGWAVFNPVDHTKWYASSSGNGGNGEVANLGYTGGIWRTINEGAWWQKIGGQAQLCGSGNRIKKLLIDPNNPDVLYAATDCGVFKTTNLNALDPYVVTWVNILPGEVYDLEMKPNSSSTLYATVRNSGTWDFKITTNSGSSWNLLPNQPSLIDNADYITMEVSNDNSEKLYSTISKYDPDPAVKSYIGKIYVYNNTSLTWQFIATTNTDFGGGHSFGVNQFNENEIYVGNSIVSKKIVIGGSTTDFYSGYHIDVEDMICHPTNSNEVWMANHGGVYKSINNGSSWQDMSNGLGVTQVLAMATSYTSPDYVITGTYHDGSMITNDPYGNPWLPSWRTISNCDGERPLIDNTNPQYMWNSCQGGLYANGKGLIPWRFSNNYGVTFSNLPTVVASGSENGWNTEGVLNKLNPSIFYRIARPKVADIYLTDEIYRSMDRGLTYSAISNFHSTLSSYTNYFVFKAYTPEADGNYLFLHIITDHGLSTETHRVFRTTIANDIASNVINSWAEIPMPRNAWLSDMDFDLNDPNIIYFTNGSSANPDQAIGTGMVLVLDNTHQLSKDLTKNLPNTGIGSDALVLEKGSNGGMYLATDFGVYYTNNKMLADQTGWIPFGTELPHVTGNGMEINYQINKIRIGTFGRGVWEHNLYCPPSYDLAETATYTSDDFKEAEHNITSTSIVNSPNNINYRAGTQIILQPGFRATTGSNFHAFIHPCDNSGSNSFSKRDEDIAVSSGTGNFDIHKTIAEKKETITVFPNPNSGIFEIGLSSDFLEESTSIQIIDIMGKVIYSKEKISQEIVKIDLNNQSIGLYLVKVSSKNKSFTQRMIINQE